MVDSLIFFVDNFNIIVQRFLLISQCKISSLTTINISSMLKIKNKSTKVQHIVRKFKYSLKTKSAFIIHEIDPVNKKERTHESFYIAFTQITCWAQIIPLYLQCPSPAGLPSNQFTLASSNIQTNKTFPLTTPIFLFCESAFFYLKPIYF